MTTKPMDIIAIIVVALLLAAVATPADACRTQYKWVCDSRGNCEWISVCE